MPRKKEKLYSRGGVAKLLELSPSRVDQLVSKMPPPDEWQNDGRRDVPLWRESKVTAWNERRLTENGRYGNASK